MLSYLFKFFTALNSNKKPGEIIHGFAIGFVIALIPTGNLLWILIFSITLFLRINKAAYFLSMLFFKLFVNFLDPTFDAIGYWVLTQPSLNNFFGTICTTPFFTFFKINNTIVLGSFLVSIVFYVPIYYIFSLLINFYRKFVHTSIVNSKIYKTFSKLPLVQKIASLSKTVGRLKIE